MYRKLECSYKLSIPALMNIPCMRVCAHPCMSACVMLWARSTVTEVGCKVPAPSSTLERIPHAAFARTKDATHRAFGRTRGCHTPCVEQVCGARVLLQERSSPTMPQAALHSPSLSGGLYIVKRSSIYSSPALHSQEVRSLLPFCLA